jgi:hypothetical protein
MWVDVTAATYLRFSRSVIGVYPLKSCAVLAIMLLGRSYDKLRTINTMIYSLC